MLLFAAIFLHGSGSDFALAPTVQQSNLLATNDLREDDLLLFSVELQQLTLTETLTAHGDAEDPLLPVGELARVLDLDIDVFVADHRIIGTIGEARRALIIDLRRGFARVGGVNITLSATEVGQTHSDIYVRASILQRLLPLHFEISPEQLSIKLTALEKLPIQARLEREGRIRDTGANIEALNEPALKIRSPYQFMTPPSFDAAVEVGRDTRTLQPYSGRYDVRMAGDVLYSNFQGYLGSDARGQPISARLLFERRSPEGGLPFGMTRLSGGDVFTPALSMGPRSAGGRGVSFSTAPLEQYSVFDTIDLRGELPIGHDVELYINDVLRSGQRTPLQGRYEFLNVPLVRGINVIRIVTYGTRGERSQVVRVIYVGGGQLPRHALQFEFGALEQGRAIVEPRPLSDEELTVAGTNGPRVVASAAYGLNEALTLVAGAALYTTAKDDSRNLATVGLRTSLRGLAVQFDGAADDRGGAGLGFGIAGRPFDVSVLLQHSEYRGRFVDETVSALDLSRSPLRHTSVIADFTLPSIAGKKIPLSLRVLRDSFKDGGISYLGSARASLTVLSTLVSTGLDYERTYQPALPLHQRLVGNLSASKFLDFKWQLRASADYELIPASALKALSFTADRSLSDRLSVRFGLGKSLGQGGDTFTQAGAVFRLPVCELAATGDYDIKKGEWRLGIRLGFGSLFDPFRHRYVLTPPGPASGGSAVFRAFLDRDADGRFSRGDEPVSKVLLEGGQRAVMTNSAGEAVITGLGNSPTATIRVNTKDLDQFYVGSAPTQTSFSPRPGRVVKVEYPIALVGEVYAKLLTNQPDGKAIGLSAVHVRLVRDGHEAIESITEYDGSVVFSDVPLGIYRLELDPLQATRLGMRLTKSPKVVVGADTDAKVDASVEFTAKIQPPADDSPLPGTTSTRP